MQINSINLNDRVAIVTGGAQGIGLAVGRRFLESGAKLVIWDLVAGRLDSAAKCSRTDQGWRIAALFTTGEKS